MIKMIIDTDPGIDDAVALASALFSNEIDVKLITTVAGNVEIDKVTENTKKLLTFFKKEYIPIAKGVEEPLIRKLSTAADIHGHSGLEGYEFEESNINILKENAILAMRNCLLESKDKITITALGPLTNIALLLKTFPEVKEKIERIVFMGGSLTRGNKGVMSEANIDVDPHAAKIVLSSNLNIVMVGLEIGWKTAILQKHVEKIREQNKTGEMLYSLLKKYRGGSFETGLNMYDSTALAYILRPNMFTSNKYFVDVEINGTYTTGATIVDLKNYLKKEANILVVTDVDEKQFQDWLVDSLKYCV